MTRKLQDRVVIVTGAGRGIGRAISVELAAQGATVVLASRNLDELDATAGLVRERGACCLALPTDVTKQGEVKTLVQAALAEFGHIDGLVNNAGIQGPIGPLVDNDLAAWMETLEVNIVGPFVCMQQVLPHMMARHQGKVVNLSGGGATSPRPNFSAYGASKAALVRLTETVAEEVRSYNIQVNAVAPGAINTRMLYEVLQAGEAAGGELEAAQRQEAEGGASAEVAARLTAFLVSPASDKLSGKLISAPHDGWQSWTNAELDRLSAKPWFTLRRMDPHTIQLFAADLPVEALS